MNADNEVYMVKAIRLSIEPRTVMYAPSCH